MIKLVYECLGFTRFRGEIRNSCQPNTFISQTVEWMPCMIVFCTTVLTSCGRVKMLNKGTQIANSEIVNTTENNSNNLIIGDSVLKTLDRIQKEQLSKHENFRNYRTFRR